MKVTYNWLKDFVDIRISPEALADKLTLAGLEVVSLNKVADDFVFEIEITSNRPDWLSIYGVAREVASITGKKFKKSLSLAPAGSKAAGTLKIQIANKKDCFYYCAKVIRGVCVKPSLAKISKRLELVGVRPVNNIVDMTNYLLFETGQPMHAFDLDKLSLDEGIIIRRARGDEKIVTLDGIERKLDKDILVISDRLKPVAIAGVIGGKDTEVTNKTKNILLETAVFDPVLVRRMRQKLGLQSEAAYRFERGVDLSASKSTSLRCASLIAETACGKIAISKEAGKTNPSAKSIKLAISAVSRTLGVEIPAAKCKSILVSLGFTVQNKSACLQVKVPGFRQDVKADVDLIEEIARIYGFGKIPSSLAKISPQAIVCDWRDKVSLLKEMLLGLGLNEAITYSMIDRDSLQKFGISVEPVAIRNPLSKEQEVLRPTVLPSLLRVVAFNLNQKQNQIGFFEIAEIFRSNEKQDPVEEPVLAIALCGERSLLLEQGAIKDAFSMLHIKGILETVFSRLGIKGACFAAVSSGEEDFIIQVSGQELGRVLSPAAVTLEAFQIKNRKVFLAQLDLAKLFALADKNRKFIPAPKYPAITRDISFIVKDNISVSRIIEAISGLGQPLINARIVDYYRGKQIPKGFRALTLSCIYRLDDRTLTEEEVNPVQEKAVKLLVDGFGAKLR
jgi:phenylalanyl-tRNA synthetase beta chain